MKRQDAETVLLGMAEELQDNGAIYDAMVTPKTGAWRAGLTVFFPSRIEAERMLTSMLERAADLGPTVYVAPKKIESTPYSQEEWMVGIRVVGEGKPS